jgi:tyrosyl-tRNA synthetase
VEWDGDDLWLPQILRDTGLCKSTSEATRLIKQGGISVDGRKVTDTNVRLSPGEYLIKVGKRRFLRVRPK